MMTTSDEIKFNTDHVGKNCSHKTKNAKLMEAVADVGRGMCEENRRARKAKADATFGAAIAAATGTALPAVARTKLPRMAKGIDERTRLAMNAFDQAVQHATGQANQSPPSSSSFQQSPQWRAELARDDAVAAASPQDPNAKSSSTDTTRSSAVEVDTPEQTAEQLFDSALAKVPPSPRRAGPGLVAKNPRSPKGLTSPERLF